MSDILKKIKVENKCQCYSKEENQVRLSIMNFTIDNKRAFNLKSDIQSMEINMDIENLQKCISNLRAKNGFVADENDNVNFIYPVSALETNHKVTLQDGRSFFAMCAIDAMGTAFTFGQDTTIKSVCSNSGNEVTVEIKGGKLYNYSPKTLHALHVDLNKFTDWTFSC